MKKKVKDSIYRDYYPVEGDDKLHLTDFVGTEEEAKNSAYDFAANFPREKVIIHKLIGDSFDVNVGDIYNDGEYEGKVTEVNSDNIIIESQDEDGEVVNIQIPIEDSDELQDYYDATNSPEYVDSIFEAVVPTKYKEKCFFDGDSEGFVVTLSEPLTADEASYLKEASIELPLEALNGATTFAVQVQPIDFDYVGDAKIKDGAERYVEDFNIDEIIDQGSTTVLCPLDEVDPEDIEFQIEQGLRAIAGENVEIPELGTEVLDTNTVVVYVL